MQPSPLSVVHLNLRELTLDSTGKRDEAKARVSLMAARTKYSVGQCKRTKPGQSSSISKPKTYAQEPEASPALREIGSGGPHEHNLIMPWDIHNHSRPSSSSISTMMINETANQSLRTRLMEQIERKRSSTKGEKMHPSEETTRPTASGTSGQSKWHSFSGTGGSRPHSKPRTSQMGVSAWTPFSSAVKATVQDQTSRTLLSVCSVLSLGKESLVKLQAHYERQRSALSELRKQMTEHINCHLDLMVAELTQQELRHKTVLEAIVAEGREARQRLHDLSSSLHTERGFLQTPAPADTGLFDILQSCRSEVCAISTWAFQAKEQSIQSMQGVAALSQTDLPAFTREFKLQLDELLGMNFKEEQVCMVACGLTPTKAGLHEA